MERSKREKNGIIIQFTFYFVLFIALVVFTISNILPQIKQIEEDKSITIELYNDIERIKKGGLSFEEFKKYKDISLVQSKENTKYINEIINGMTDDFYTNNLVNFTEVSYEKFLEKKANKLNSTENQFIAKEKRNQIAKLLPKYAGSLMDLGGEGLSDYKFINYIESIIESFNLSTTNSIGISKLILLDDFAVSNNDGEGLDSNIYYIPLNLILKGDKAGIIDFLYFIENVGNISLIEKNIYLNTDFQFLSKNGIKKVLEGDRYSSSYNIFEHQIIDISRITMNEYIDGSYKSRQGGDFKDFLIKTQGNNEYEININLMFYVKGLPIYEIEGNILNILEKHQKALGLVINALTNIDIKGAERTKLMKNNDILKQLSKEIITIRKSLVKKENLDELYKRVLVIDSIIDPIFKSLQK